MRQLIITLCIVGLFLEISGLLWSSKKDKPSEVFVRLSEAPVRTIEHPLQNGYFLLVGFAAASSLDPVQVGYDIWLETDIKSVHRGFDLTKPGRSELRLPLTFDQLLPEWNVSDPVTEFQRRHASVRAATIQYSTLLQRYAQWLTMRFEDWGYAHRGVPRIDDVLGAHRLYIAEGFGQQTKTGLERLAADLARWRYVLQEARTLPMKLMAEVAIEDDVQLLSRILSRATVDQAVLIRGLHLLQPLTSAEYSLKWPIQSQFMLGYALGSHPDRDGMPYPGESNGPEQASLAHAARLQPESFHAVDHPHPRTFWGLSSTSQRTWDTYATFYDATIKAAESIHSPLPKLYDIARHSQLTLMERMVNPLEFSPDWEVFSQRLVETDARLRLAALQILMRNPSATGPIPTRLAEVGSRYFDPFTGLPMLWSPTQKKLYSVGKDGLDDGGDPTFDISVPLSWASKPSASAEVPSSHS
ncbi:MAG TPA: hypothetical protein VD738_00855 [Nitrospira sp.]|nr:hypothetical protein [Nitrospira sp.]